MAQISQETVELLDELKSLFAETIDSLIADLSGDDEEEEEEEDYPDEEEDY